MSKNPKIVLWDVEISGIVATTWNLYPESISHENMIEDWFMISVAWKELGKKKIEAVSVLDDPKRFAKNHKDDYYVVKQVRDMLDDVDILIAHNNDRFDLKAFNGRLIYHQLPPLPKILSVDTLKEAKKVAKFTSNRLDFLAKIFSGEGKMHTPPGTWLKAMNGDVDAINLMVKYNKVDIRALEDVYLRLLPYMKSHPNIATPDTCNCPKCNSNKTVRDGTRMRSTGARFQTYRCGDCGASFTDTKTLVKPLSKI
jgi:hypothetical protein